jgi:hypothetical protein
MIIEPQGALGDLGLLDDEQITLVGDPFEDFVREDDGAVGVPILDVGAWKPAEEVPELAVVREGALTFRLRLGLEA